MFFVILEDTVTGSKKIIGSSHDVNEAERIRQHGYKTYNMNGCRILIVDKNTPPKSQTAIIDAWLREQVMNDYEVYLCQCHEICHARNSILRTKYIPVGKIYIAILEGEFIKEYLHEEIDFMRLDGYRILIITPFVNSNLRFFIKYDRYISRNEALSIGGKLIV